MRYNRDHFFDHIKERIDATLNQEQVNGLSWQMLPVVTHFNCAHGLLADAVNFANERQALTAIQSFNNIFCLAFRQLTCVYATASGFIFRQIPRIALSAFMVFIQHVIPRSSEKQTVRTNARWIIASVQNFFVGRVDAKMNQIRNTVGTISFASQLKTTISVFIQMCSPIPASVQLRTNVCKKAVNVFWLKCGNGKMVTGHIASLIGNLIRSARSQIRSAFYILTNSEAFY